MQNHDCILHARQPVVQPDVEDNTNEHDGEHEQRALPSRSGVVGVLDDDQGLDQSTADEASGSISGLRLVFLHMPMSYNTYPACQLRVETQPVMYDRNF